LPDDGRQTELVRGNIIELEMPGAQHGKTCGRVALFVGMYNEQHDRGHVFTNDTSVVTERHPDTVRGADVAFVSYGRLPRGPVPLGFLEVAPNVVFEVRSPTDRWKVILQKVTEYFNCGVDCVCVLDPLSETVRVYTPDEPETALHGDNLLEFPQQMPGFSVAVRRFFE
jgi:Uma2 family endonuclease